LTTTACFSHFRLQTVHCLQETLAPAPSPPRPIPINAVFNVLPIRCTLQPGQSDRVEFVFYGHTDRMFMATAVCGVASAI